MNPIINLLKNHRSIRKFTDQPITDEQLDYIIQAGQSAATSSNLQARTIVRITDYEKRKTLAQIAGNQQYIVSAPEFLVFCADFNRANMCCAWQKVEMASGMTEHCIIAVTDTAIMAQNCVIAAQSMGLGICYIGALRNNPQQVCSLLDLPQQTFPIFGLCLGYPAQNPEIKPRLPVSIILKHNNWKPDDQQQIKKYNSQLQQYYLSRTQGIKKSNWTTEISTLLVKESRPHMKKFLKSKGFILK